MRLPVMQGSPRRERPSCRSGRRREPSLRTSWSGRHQPLVTFDGCQKRPIRRERTRDRNSESSLVLLDERVLATADVYQETKREWKVGSCQRYLNSRRLPSSVR